MREGQRRTAVLPVLDAVAAGLEAGLPAGTAMTLAVSTTAEDGGTDEVWEELGRRATEGQPLGPGWERAARRTADPAVAAVARSWQVGERTGAPLADAVRAGAHSAREAERLRRAVQTATAGARATSTVLTLLPLAGVGLALLLGVGPAQLYGSWAAVASGTLGLALLGLGHLVVRRMVAAVGRGIGG